jgi:serine/threonine protein phosphatase PrpC
MEDTHVYEALSNNTHFFGIFDGHGGAEVAEMCRDNFPKVIKQGLRDNASDPAVTIYNSFMLVDNLAAHMERVNATGSTAVICLIYGSTVWFANAGDSMTMVAFDDGRVEMMSQEHKVENEKERIREAGGVVTYGDGCARIFGTLNVSRSIGDHFMKKFVIATPFIRSISRDLYKIKYILMASDGIWDVFTATELYNALNNNSEMDIRDRLLQIIELAKQKGSTDNITITYCEL